MKKILLNVFLVSSVCFLSCPAFANGAKSSNPSNVKGSVYEEHMGLFVKGASYEMPEPMLGTHAWVSRPLISTVSETDRWIGKVFHTTTYEDEYGKSNVKLDDPDGARIGFDF